MISEDVKEKIRQLAGENVSVYAISKETGVSRQTIYRILDNGGGQGRELELDGQREQVSDQASEVNMPVRHRSHLSKRIRPVSQASPELRQAREDAEHLELQLRQARTRNALGRETVSEHTEETQKKRERWLQRWIGFALDFFDEDIDLEVKLKVKGLVSSLLRGVDTNEDSESIGFLIGRKIEPILERYNQKFLPLMKQALIDFIMERITLPYLLPEERQEIEQTIRESLGRCLRGDENELEELDLAQVWVNEMVAEL